MCTINQMRTTYTYFHLVYFFLLFVVQLIVSKTNWTEMGIQQKAMWILYVIYLGTFAWFVAANYSNDLNDSCRAKCVVAIGIILLVAMVIFSMIVLVKNNKQLLFTPNLVALIVLGTVNKLLTDNMKRLDEQEECI